MADPQTEPFSEDFNVVLIGNLNPAIFHPEWFCRHGLIGPEAAADAKVEVVSPPVAEIDIGHIHIQCTSDRMVIRTSRSSHTEMLLDLVRGILTLLPHTPLTAAGINHEAHYHVGNEEQWHTIGHELAPKEPVWKSLCEEPGMLRLVIQSPKSGWEFPLESNLTVEPISRRHPKHPAIVVRANTHFGLSSMEKGSPEPPTDQVSRFLTDQWESATGEARKVAAKIFEFYPSK